MAIHWHKRPWRKIAPLAGDSLITAGKIPQNVQQSSLLAYEIWITLKPNPSSVASKICNRDAPPQDSGVVCSFHLCLVSVACLVQRQKTCTKHSGTGILHIDDGEESSHNHSYSYVKQGEETVCGYVSVGRNVGKESGTKWAVEQNLEKHL